MNHIETAKQMAAQLQEKLNAAPKKAKTYRVWKCTPTGQLLSSLEDVEVGEGEGLEEVLRDVAEFHTNDGEACEYLGWQGGVYEFGYEWDGETQSLFLTVEEI